VSFTLELPGAGVTVAVTNHALERYCERVRPHLDGLKRLHADMVRLAATCGATSPQRPDWATWDWNGGDDEIGRLYVHCGDICLVVKQSPPGSRLPGAVVTVLARGHMSEIARRDRNRYRAARTWRKTRQGGQKMPRRHVHSPEPTLE
jgi:hypothetical protein